MKSALEDEDYAELFKIESTSSVDAHRGANQRLEDDPTNRLVNEKIMWDNKKIIESNPKNKNLILRQSVERPKSISRKWSKRTCKNKMQFSIYKILRILFVSVWFYYFPFIVVVTSNVWPVISHWKDI